MQVTIVTGASSGIGRAVALRLAAAGRTVVAAARRAEELEAVVAQAQRTGGRAVAVPTDVTELADLENLVDKAGGVGPVDGLVNVAGLGRVHSVLADDADVQRLLAVNLLAPIRLMRLVVPGMRERGRGSIVNIGSIAGEIGVDGPYSASKFGLRGMTDSVRRELAGTGIGVTLVEPGYVATAMTAGRTGRMPGPEVVADAVADALERPRRRVIVPGRYRAVAALAAVAPAAIDRQFAGVAGGAAPPPMRIAELAGRIQRRRARSGDVTRSPAVVVGGLAWVVGTLQYAICQVVVALAYVGRYSLHDNYISDLGNTACGPFAVPHGVAMQVCSPEHAVMNTSFVVIGVLTLVGAVLLRPFWPAGRLATTGVALWVLAGLGKVVVGLVPENADTGLHLLGAFNIPVGSVAILLLSIAVRRSAPALAGLGTVLAVLGLLGTALSTAGQFAPALYLGLGAGGAERLAGYPGNLWMLVVGALALAARRAPVGAHEAW